VLAHCKATPFIDENARPSQAPRRQSRAAKWTGKVLYLFYLFTTLFANRVINLHNFQKVAMLRR
jgi:hypothetical protein